MADKVTRTRTFPHPDLSFLGLVTFAYKISAMMIIHPDANPSPRQEYTKQSKFQKSQTSPTSKATNYHMVPSCLGGAPVCSGALLVAQGEFWLIRGLPGCSGGILESLGSSWSHPGVIMGHPWVILVHPGVILVHPGVILIHPGVILGHPGVILESSWSNPGSSWSG